MLSEREKMQFISFTLTYDNIHHLKIDQSRIKLPKYANIFCSSFLGVTLRHAKGEDNKKSCGNTGVRESCLELGRSQVQILVHFAKNPKQSFCISLQSLVIRLEWEKERNYLALKFCGENNK